MVPFSRLGSFAFSVVCFLSFPLKLFAEEKPLSLDITNKIQMRVPQDNLFGAITGPGTPSDVSVYDQLQEGLHKVLDKSILVDKLSPKDIDTISQSVSEELLKKYAHKLDDLRLHLDFVLGGPDVSIQVDRDYWDHLKFSSNDPSISNLKKNISLLIASVAEQKKLSDGAGYLIFSKIREELFSKVIKEFSSLFVFLDTVSDQDVEDLFANHKEFNNEQKRYLKLLWTVSLQVGGLTNAVKVIKKELMQKFDLESVSTFSNQKIAALILKSTLEEIDSHALVSTSFSFFSEPIENFSTLRSQIPQISEKLMSLDPLNTTRLGLVSVRSSDGIWRSMSSLKIASFSSKNYDLAIYDFERKLKEAQENDSLGLLIDLRDNPGGAIDLMNSLLGMLINKTGSVLYSTWNRRGEKLEDFVDSPSYLYRKPIVVLVNRQTASAAEIMASVLRHRGRAYVLGDDRTYGKAVVTDETTFEKSGSGGSSDLNSYIGIRSSVGIAHLPNGTSHQFIGINPNLNVPSYSQLIKIGERYLKRKPEIQKDKEALLDPDTFLLSSWMTIPQYIQAKAAIIFNESFAGTLNKKHLLKLQDLNDLLKDSREKLCDLDVDADNPLLNTLHEEEWADASLESLYLQYQIATDYIVEFSKLKNLINQN